MQSILNDQLTTYPKKHHHIVKNISDNRCNGILMYRRDCNKEYNKITKTLKFMELRAVLIGDKMHR